MLASSYIQLGFIFAFGAMFQQTFASLGDNLQEFQRCVEYCDILKCGNRELYPEVSSTLYQNLLKDEELLNSYETAPISLFMSFLGWDCQSNCDYQCQRLVTEDRKSENLEIYQFHGKWPFIRVFGIQELFSTLFSIGNFIPNYWGFQLLWKHYKLETKKGNSEFVTLYGTYIIVSIISMCAWFFSTLFHLKDTWDRERLDYFFAGMTVLSGFYAIVVRFFKLYKIENTFKRNVIAVVCILMYVGHITRLLVDWSYTYNMQANVIIGILQNFLWVYLSCIQFKKISNKNLSFIENLKNKDVNWTLSPIALVVSVLFGMSFEIFDFPPVFELVDAHAMWHFVTIWPTIWWYPYMVKDSEGLMDFKFD